MVINVQESETCIFQFARVKTLFKECRKNSACNSLTAHCSVQKCLSPYNTNVPAELIPSFTAPVLTFPIIVKMGVNSSKSIGHSVIPIVF